MIQKLHGFTHRVDRRALLATCAIVVLALETAGAADARASGSAATAAMSPPSGADARAATSLVFGPVRGQKLWKRISVEHNLVLMSRDFVQNGVAQLSQQEMELASRHELHVEDEYRALDAERPTVLWRSFDRVRQMAVLSFSDQPGGRLDGKSPLEGVSVVFTWVPEENGYGVYCDAAEAPELYLSGLSEDLDLRALLPGRAVQPGDTWEIKPDSLKDALAFGGNLPIKFARSSHGTFGRTMMSGVGGGLHSVFEAPLQGRVAARFVSLRTTEASAEAPARELAVIALEVKLEANVDQTKHTQRSVRADEFHKGMSVSKATLQWTFEGTGEVLWDVPGKRLESYTLQGKEVVKNDLRFGPQRDSENRQAIHMAGTMKVKFDVLTTPPAVVDDENVEPIKRPGDEPADDTGDGSGDDSGDDSSEDGK